MDFSSFEGALRKEPPIDKLTGRLNKWVTEVTSNLNEWLTDRHNWNSRTLLFETSVYWTIKGSLIQIWKSHYMILLIWK